MRRGAIVLLIVIIIILVNLIFPISELLNNGLFAEAETLINTFDDKSEEKVVKVPSFDYSFNLEVPINAEVLKATLNLSVLEYNSDHPLNPYLRLGTDQSSLWRYQGTGYGAFGHQYSFSTGFDEDELTYYGENEIDKLKVFIPTDADVYYAKLNLTGIEHDYWSKEVQQLNLEPDGAGDYEPEMIVFKNKLFVVYRTYYDKVTNGSDSDIVITYTFNGANWSVLEEITSAPDSLPPYNDTYTSADWRPTLETFKNKLYCAWESNSTDTTGPDRDILLRSSSDGINWDTIINISDQWEASYSDNPGLKNDWGIDMIEFNNKLWAVWITNNTDNFGEYSSPIGDIIITNSSDGIIWSEPVDLTSGDDWYITDLAPTLAVFNNSLYVAWVSNNSKFSEEDDNDYDIVYRNTTDGLTWNDLRAINPHDNNWFTHKGSIDTSPKLTTYEDNLFCVWISGATYTHGSDLDVYMRYTTRGDFSEIGKRGEITDITNTGYDHSPEIAVFGSRIYFTWVTEIQENDEFVNSDIMVRFFDTATGEFGNSQMLNPPDVRGFDYWPQLKVFNDVLYAAWDSNSSTTGTGLDRDIIFTLLTPSKLPLRFGMDVGADGTWDIPEDTPIQNVKTEIDLKNSFKKLYLNQTWLDQNSKTTSYGFRMCEIPLKVRFNEPGKIKVEDLKIIYNCTMQVKDFSHKLNEYILKNEHKATTNNTLIVPFRLSAETRGKILISDIKINLDFKPTINLVDLPATGETVNEPVYRIKWKDFDPDSNALISLYYDTDEKGEDGELIISNLSEDDKNNYFDWVWWNWKNLRDGGKFYIYANITDGRNFFVNYSNQPLNIQKIDIKDFINVTILEPDGINDSAWDNYVIKWSCYCPDGKVEIAFYYDDNNIGFNGKAIDLNDDGVINESDVISESDCNGINSIKKFTWNISDNSPGSSYFIYAKITNKWNISYYNYSLGAVKRLYMPAPRNFTILDDLDPSDSNLTTHDPTPRLKWLPPLHNLSIGSNELKYILKIWLGEDGRGEKVFEITTKNTEITVSKPLQYGEMYYAEVFAQLPNGNESMKSSIIFSIVNNKPLAPEIIITPSKPKTDSILMCSIVIESIDHDGDEVEYLYYWYRNDIPQNAYNNETSIPSPATSKDEHWRCMVIPYDGIELGQNTSYEVTIRNSAPTIQIKSPKAEKEYSEDDVISFEFTVSDPDPGDIEKIQFIIYDKNKNNIIKTGYVQSSTGVVEFTYKLSTGTHNLFFNISDGSSSSEVELEIKVKEKMEDGLSTMMLFGLYGIILIIVILIIIFILLFNRMRSVKKSEEEEKEKEIKKEEEEINELLDELSLEEPIEQMEEDIEAEEPETEDVETELGEESEEGLEDDLVEE